MEKKSFSLKEIAAFTGTLLEGNPEYRIFNVADLETADAEDASFLSNPRYEQMMRRSHAGVIFIAPHSPRVEGRNFLVSPHPSEHFQILVEKLHADAAITTGFEGIHPTAILHESVSIGKHVSIGPYTVIDKGVVIGEGCSIGAGCSIGPGSTLGDSCTLHPHVTIREGCHLGNRVVIQPGAVIGSCGFGYLTDAKGTHKKLNQVGTVTIEYDVEIGANTTIDRARFKTTRISAGTKIDNLVQIGHGVTIGKSNLIVSQVGIAGSSMTGNHVVLAGQVGIAGHIKIGDGVVLSAKSGASKSILEKGNYGGAPAMPMEAHNRMSVHLRNIDKFVKELKELQKQVNHLK